MNFLESIFITAIWVVAIGTVLFLLVCVPALGAALGIDGGPSSFIIGALIGSTIMVGVLYYPGRVLAETISYQVSEIEALSIVFSAIVFCGGMFLPVMGVSEYAALAQKLQKNAESVRARGLQLFDSIDANHNGILDESELKSASSNPTLSESDRVICTDMLDTLKTSGHTIGSREVDSVMVCGEVVIPTTETVDVYGIGKSDLEVYPQRIQEKYKNWL